MTFVHVHLSLYHKPDTVNILTAVDRIAKNYHNYDFEWLELSIDVY